jgi:elongator complex protein 3
MLKPGKNEVRKPTRTISGVSPVAVMLPPRKCEHGACVYCPNLDVPQSYTPKSPVVLRALQVDYDAFEQVRGRLKAFKAMNHLTEKVEIIIMGGTFLQYPKEFQYEFVKGCYDGLNGRRSRDLASAKKLNERAKHRCVALCVETRPDVCVEFIDRLREFGCTRVELGVQMPDDAIYKKTNRGHSVKDVVEATCKLKNAGFKVGYHIMPGLPGSNIKKDLSLFKKLFSDSKFKPDQLKIYPCQVLKGAELEDIYWKKRYKPYTKEQTEKILIEMMRIVPRYCRVMRVMREIPPEYLVAGTTKIDLRKDVEEKLRKKGEKIKEIRFREIGFNCPLQISARKTRVMGEIENDKTFLVNDKINNNQTLERGKLKLHHGRTPKDFKKKSLLRAKITKYKASGGEEYFLEIVNSKDILFGLLRLRIIDVTSNKKTRLFSKINNSGNSRATLERGKSAIIRELHVYGKALGLGDSAHPTRARAQDSHKPSQTTRASRERSPILKNGSWVQHTGLGKQLMKKAEELAKDNCCEELKVISGVGVREYYKKLGYKLDGSYMVKEL